MAKQDFLPDREESLIVWYGNWAAKLPGYQAALGLSAAEVADALADAAAVAATLLALAQAKSEQQEWVAFKNLELHGTEGGQGGPTPQVPTAPPAAVFAPRPPGIIRRTRRLAARIKTHPAYTAALGHDLGIVGVEPSVPEVVKPRATARGQAGYEVVIRFVKHGFDGVEVESQRGAETTWTPLGFDAVSPYVDRRSPLAANEPEARRYRLRYRRRDQPVGVFSDLLNVLVGP